MTSSRFALRSSLLAALTLAAACKSAAPPAPAPVAAAPAPLAATASSADSAAERAKRDAAEKAARDAAAARAKADSAAAAKANAASAVGATDARKTILATVYFDYDASELRDDGRTLLEAKVPVLTANPSLRIRISGHADDRGSDEYNLALGQRRSAALKRFLTQRGIDEGRISIASFGEEKPVCTQEDEACFVKNRRAEFEITAGGETIVAPTK
jgi:peptidoglycan-associated lipoprotein